MKAFKNVRMAPYEYGKMPMQGGAWSENDPLLRHYRNKIIESRPDDFDTLTFEEMSGSHFFGGPLFLHFGHFIMESLARIWALPQAKDRGLIDLNSKIVFNVFHSDRNIDIDALPQYIHQIFSIIGVNPSDIMIVRNPIIVENLIVAEQGCGLNYEIKRGFLNFVKETRAPKSPEAIKDSENGKLLYVSRQAYRSRGNYLGESLIEATLSQNGFEIFYPELHSIEEQIRTFEEARGIIFAESSAIHLLLLCTYFRGKVIVVKRRFHEPFSKQLEDQDISFETVMPEILLSEIYPVGSRVLSYCNLDLVVNLANSTFGTEIKPLNRRGIADAISTELCWHSMRSSIQDFNFFQLSLSSFLKSIRSLPVDTTEAEKAIYQLSRAMKR